METPEQVREARGLRIAQAKRIKAVGAVWIVPSESHAGSYAVAFEGGPSCTCPDYELRRAPCKHVFAVEFSRRHRQLPDGSTVTELKITYGQNWPAYNQAQVREKDLVQQLLRELCSGIENPEYQGGRPRLPLSDVVFACVLKVYEGTSGRRASTDVRQAAASGLIDRAPHYNSISSYLDRPELTPLLKGLIEASAQPLKAVELDFAADATGFSTSVYHRWYDQKYGRRRKESKWLKAHAMIGTKTNIVTAIEVTAGELHDSPQFVGLVETTAQNFTMARVSADKAYLSMNNLEAVERFGAVPYIPLKLNSKPNNNGAWMRLWHLFSLNRNNFLAHYHKRSNVESSFSSMKRLFGGHLRSKKFRAQQNELLCKVLAYNLTCVVHSMFELGIEPNFAGAR